MSASALCPGLACRRRAAPFVALCSLVLALVLASSDATAQMSRLNGAEVVANGGDHACVITREGGVRCWGVNDNGQLGDGSYANRTTPTEVLGLNQPVVELALGHWHSCALLADATMACWGNNGFGQLGDGSGSGSPLPVAVSGLSNITHIDSGYFHMCAIANGGNVYCWGWNEDGQLGLNDKINRLEPAQVTGFPGVAVSVAAGYVSSCAALSSGGIQCWGDNDSGGLGNGGQAESLVPTAVLGLRCGADPVGSAGCKFAQVSVGNRWACGRHNGGGVMCWGHNADAEVGDGSFQNRLNPVDVLNAGSGVVDLESGFGHSCVRMDDGSMRCWGQASNGQIGDGTYTRRTVAAEVAGLGNVEDIGVGNYHTCALVSGGRVKCWGNNRNGQLGNATTTSVLNPVDAAFSGILAQHVDTGFQFSCAVSNAGQVYCWGEAALVNGQIREGLASKSLVPTLVEGLDNIVRVAAGESHACALNTSGGVACWGDNGSGQLGGGFFGGFFFNPITPAGMESGVIEMAAGGNHTCVLKSTGTPGQNQVHCWGANFVGQLGNGTQTSSHTPILLDGLADTVSIGAGWRHTCAVAAGGGAQCWGENITDGVHAGGQLGDGTRINRLEPTPVVAPGVSFTRIDGGGTFSCGLTTEQRVKCWGDNDRGQLGTGDFSAQLTPVDVQGLDVDIVAISVGGLHPFLDAHACALTAVGEVYCWGSNGNGQLGDGSSLPRPLPTLSGLNINTVDIGAGGNHSCARSTSGQVRCWGLDQFGQIGDAGRDTTLADFVLDVRTDDVRLASDGNQASEDAVSDASGRFIIFESDATDLVAGDTNGFRDIFRRDTLTGEVERISVDDGEGQISGGTIEPATSANGSFIVFVAPINGVTKVANESRRKALTASLAHKGGSQSQGIFLRNLLTGSNGSTMFIAPALPFGQGSTPQISADGSAVVFTSLPPSSDIGVPNQPAVFVQPFQVNGAVLTPTTGAPICVSCRSVDSNGNEVAQFADGESSAPVVSGDGSVVAFQTQSKNLLAATPSPCATGSAVILRNLLTGMTRMVSPTPGTSTCGTEGASSPSIDSTGNVIAFQSDAPLKPNDANGLIDIYVVAGSQPPVRVSQDPQTSADSNGGSVKPTLSGDGRVVAFSTLAKNVEGSEPDNNEAEDIVVVRRDTLATQKISVSKRRDQGNGGSKKPALNYNGTRVAYDSQANNLVLDPATGLPIDSNGVRDVMQSFNSLVSELVFYNGME